MSPWPSGWIAGIAAFATIKILVNQARAQQSQTDFTLGDAMPTCDIMEDDDNISTVVIRVVNWNRRTLLIEQIEPQGPLPYDLKLDDVEVSQRKYQILYDDDGTEFDPPIRCGGWENRSLGPARALIRLRAVPNGQEEAVPLVHDIRLEITCRLLGESHKPIKLLAEARLRSFHPSHFAESPI